MTKESTMKKRFYVIDGQENVTSFNGDKDQSEYFITEKAAIARAMDLAESEPGKGFYVCQSLHIVASPVAAAKVVSTK